MVFRLKIILAVTAVVLLLGHLLASALNGGVRPWDEPVVCPRCQSEQVVYILYGEPNLDQDLKDALARRKVVLGGCIVTPDSKRWECGNCGYTWGKVGP